MTEQEVRQNATSADLVVVTFSKEITPRDTSFNHGQPFREVTWHNVWHVLETVRGLHVQFEPEGAEYTYPWHTIDRVKVQRFH